MNQEDAVAKLAELGGSQKIEEMTAAEVVQDIAYKVVDRVLAAFYGS